MSQVQEKMLEKDKKLYCAFVDLEKAYDTVPRHVVLWCLRKRGVPERLVKIVEELYMGATTRVWTEDGITKEFEMNVRLHQGAAFSLFLFDLVIDVLCESIAKEELWQLPGTLITMTST